MTVMTDGGSGLLTLGAARAIISGFLVIHILLVLIQMALETVLIRS